jgi:tRNA1(Val) A37 N6-methylase TrmN6
MVEKTAEVAFETTSDAWLGGRLKLRQPLKGHRVGSDAALLAAAAPKAERIVDVGAGVGAVGLALLKRFESAKAELVEIDVDIAKLAEENAESNGLALRARIAVADVTAARSRRAAGLKDGQADLVVTNPPFFASTKMRLSPEDRRARAHAFNGEGATLATWIKGALALLAPGGRFVMIHRPEALAEILVNFKGRLGGVAILPVHPKAAAPAHRLLIFGVKGARSPMSMRPPLVLHDEKGAFTIEAEALHRGGAAIDWPEG